MRKRAIWFIAFMILILGALVGPTSYKAYAQGSTKILLVPDKTEYKVGDTVKLTLQAQNVVEMFGLQFTIHYDPSVLQLQGEGMDFKDDYTIFGGVTVDTKNGILTYPLINQGATTEKIDSEVVGTVSFKALKKAPVVITMDKIKAVNKNSEEINYNTQTQAVFNIFDQPAVHSTDTSTSAPASSGTTVSGKTGSSGTQSNSTVKKETPTAASTVNTAASNNSQASDAQTASNTVKPAENNTGDAKNVQAPEAVGKPAENSIKTTAVNGTKNTVEIILLIVLLIQALGTGIFLIKNKMIFKKDKNLLTVNNKQTSGEAE